MAAALSLHAPLATLQADLVALLRKAVAAAADTTTPADTRVHELRKRLKRARAWAQLLPADTARPVDRALRTVHRALGNRRDLDATLEAIRRLRAVCRHAGRDTAGNALARVATSVRRARDTAATRDDGLATARAQLDGLARALDSQPPDGDFADLATAVAAVAARSRKAMRHAFASGAPADYHRWRKWMKYHQFHLRYLLPLWPDRLRAEAAAAEHCAAWLGESQDLELVRAAMQRAGLDAAAQQALTALLDREQHRLLHQAASAGLHLHATAPRTLAKQLRRYADARLYRHTGP